VLVPLDDELNRRAREGRPIRVVVSGAGFMGRHITRQVAAIEGMQMAGVVNRTPEKAAQNLADAGYARVEQVDTVAGASRVVAGGAAFVTSDPGLCAPEGVDVVIETTGDVEFGARVAVAAIAARTHVVLDNAELDATVGPLLKARADAAGVVFTDIDGDEPGVAMNLIRFVRLIGLRPVFAGNIKGFLDPYRNPATQAGFAQAHGQDPAKVASFADGTKLAAECTVLANATGFGVARRGMLGHRMEDVAGVLDLFSPEELLARPLVDFVLGARPGSGVFVVGHDPHPERRAAMAYLKMGEGPLHLFTRPFHLPHLEAPLSAARAVLFGDPTVAPIGAPVCEVIAVAKKDLEAGETLDGVGGFTWYGLIDNAAIVAAERLLPMGLAEGAVLKRAIAKDAPIGLTDVDLPSGRLIDSLRAEQAARFPLA
jgi:predicted homoserine dehydrogenase-like protein